MDHQLIVEFFKGFDFQTIISVGIIVWWFYTRLDTKIEKLDERLSNQIQKVDEKLTNQIQKVDEKLTNQIEKVDQKLSNRIDKLDEKVTDIDRRICRLEGAFASKDCCMIKDEKHIQKAE